jgi:DNA (cytosine-5)-methyltransferase 1
MGDNKTVEWWDEWAPRQQAADGRSAPHGRSLAIEAQRLLPTPKASPSGPDYARVGRERSGGDDLVTFIAKLLPTPTTRDWKDGGDLPNVPVDSFLGRTVWPRVDWTIYAGAIERWEDLTYPAPAPTEQVTSTRLAMRFVEWMMGLPAGYVTDVPGLTRPQISRALGNGVVPQQARHALRLLLELDTAP